MALTVAAAPVSVVTHGIPRTVAIRRKVRSSKNDSRPSGVLMTRPISRFNKRSPTWGRPLVHLVDRLDVETVRPQIGGGAVGGEQREPETSQVPQRSARRPPCPHRSR